MAYQSGTAANYKNLLEILTTFATANGWAVLEQSATQLYLQGEGLSGLDEIYIGIQTYENPASGYYNWRMAGSWGYRPGRAFTQQPQHSGVRYLYLWNSSIPYWLVCDAATIVLAVKINSVYQMAYLGFGARMGTQNQYPYPLIIGGCGSIEAQAYSVASANNSMAWSNRGDHGLISVPGGDWLPISPSVCPVYNENYEFNGNIITAPGEVYSPEALFVCDAARHSTLAQLKWLYRVSGYNNAAENIVTVDGTNYLVIPDVYRVTLTDYCMLRLQ